MYMQGGIFNVFLASLIIYLVWNKSTKRLLIGVFCYATFHFLYSVISLNSPVDLVSMHTGSGDMVVKITGVIFISFVFMQLIVQLYRYIFTERSINIYFGVVMGLVFIGFIVQFQLQTRLQIQNLISIEAMLMLLWLMYIGLKLDSSRLYVKPRHLHILNAVISVALMVAFYEVFFQHAWARYGYNGQLLFRASSFLFNPNLFGMWCAMLYLGLSFLFHRDDLLSKKTILIGLFLLSGCLYLSGSRSFIYLLILMLITVLPLIKGKTVMQLFTPLAILLSTFVAISGFSGLIADHSQSDVSSGWQSVELVGERILSAPLDLVKYGAVNIDNETATAIAINGRFKGDGRDSGILTLYDDMGWIGLLAIIGLGFVFCVWATKVYLVKKDVTSAYALVMLLFCGAVGITMRYQVFPVWVFIAIALSPCLALWRTVLVGIEKNH